MGQYIYFWENVLESKAQIKGCMITMYCWKEMTQFRIYMPWPERKLYTYYSQFPSSAVYIMGPNYY